MADFHFSADVLDAVTAFFLDSRIVHHCEEITVLDPEIMRFEAHAGVQVGIVHCAAAPHIELLFVVVHDVAQVPYDNLVRKESLLSRSWPKRIAPVMDDGLPEIPGLFFFLSPPVRGYDP